MGSWYELLDIAREERALAELDQYQPPMACPNDGEPLEEVNGVRHCRYDGYEWPRDAVR